MEWSYLIERITDYWPKLFISLKETMIMMGFSTLAAVGVGLPLGTFLFLAAKQDLLGQKRWARIAHSLLSLVINIIRSFPFLLLVVALQPIVRMLYGRATGNPVAASFSMMVIASALYARFVEQSLFDVPIGIIETAQAMGATIWQIVFKFLYVEARSSLIIGFTTAFVSFLSYSTIMGVIGGGGIGDFAIRYGYQRYESDIMYFAIVLIIILVQIFQYFGLKLAQKIDKR